MEREVCLHLAASSLPYTQPFLHFPQIWNRDCLRVTSGFGRQGHRGSGLEGTSWVTKPIPWHLTGIICVGGSAPPGGKRPSEPRLSRPGPCSWLPAMHMGQARGYGNREVTLSCISYNLEKGGGAVSACERPLRVTAWSQVR